MKQPHVPVRHEYLSFKIQWPAFDATVNNNARDGWRLHSYDKFGASNFETDWLVVMERLVRE